VVSLFGFLGGIACVSKADERKGQDGKFDESRDSVIGVHNPGFTPFLDANEFFDGSDVMQDFNKRA
jgi:hypothetical protein